MTDLEKRALEFRDLQPSRHRLWQTEGHKLAAVRHGPFQPLYWFQQRRPEQDRALSRFLDTADKIMDARDEGWVVTLCERQDGRDRPSLDGSRKAVFDRWPRLTALLMTANGLSQDEATYAIWCYIKGISGELFNRSYTEIIDRAVCLHFGYCADGSVPYEGKAKWQKKWIEAMLRKKRIFIKTGNE